MTSLRQLNYQKANHCSFLLYNSLRVNVRLPDWWNFSAYHNWLEIKESKNLIGNQVITRDLEKYIPVHDLIQKFELNVNFLKSKILMTWLRAEFKRIWISRRHFQEPIREQYCSASTCVGARAVQTTLTFVNKTQQRAQLQFNTEFRTSRITRFLKS